jgi:hypothetical protein
MVFYKSCLSTKATLGDMKKRLDCALLITAHWQNAAFENYLPPLRFGETLRLAALRQYPNRYH